MTNLVKRKLFNFFVLVAAISASKITWFGTYEAKKPRSLIK